VAAVKYTVTFHSEFDVEIDAENQEHAQTLARHVLTQFPVGKIKLISVEEAREADASMH
jgi:hypothetical protein